MKKLITLILLLSFFSCDKDEPDTLGAKYSKEEIFNAVVGTWKFNRLAYDPEFKNIENVTYEECGRNNYTIFEKDSTLTCIRDCGKLELVETGSFYVQIGGIYQEDNNTYIRTERSGIILKPGIMYGGGITLHHFTDSTLIFSITEYPNSGGVIKQYSELKRVK